MLLIELGLFALALRPKVITMAEWQQLPEDKKH